jgi:4-hydroxy-3-methylbut-2-enyl diphosphate reductase
VREQASKRALRVVDATCPLVAKVHQEVRRFRDRGFDVVVIGHAGHDEVIGILGNASGVHLVERPSDVPRLRVADPNRVACVTQTTLSREDVAALISRLRRRFPQLVEPTTPDICYATRNRQEPAAWLARRVDVVLVVGDPASSNSRRLVEVASAAGTPAYLINGVAGLRDEWLRRATTVGVTAGASTPEEVVSEVTERLCRQGAVLDELVLLDERVSFSLPQEVRSAPSTRTGARNNVGSGATPHS